MPVSIKWRVPAFSLFVLGGVVKDQLWFKADLVSRIIGCWDRKEPLPPDLEEYWKSLTTAQRREVKHDYDLEKDN